MNPLKYLKGFQEKKSTPSISSQLIAVDAIDKTHQKANGTIHIPV